MNNTKVTLTPLFLCALLFICYRLIYLFFAHPHFLFIYPDEELYRGAVAVELVNGLKMPLLDYRPDNFAGGFYVVSTLTSLFFRIFSPTLFALKLSPLTFSLITFIFWYLTIKRNVNSKAANLFAFIFIFAPFDFIRYSFSNLGDHAESMAFTASTIFFYFESIKRKSNSFYFILGALIGLGIWFCYTTFIILPTLLLFSFFFHRQSIKMKNLFCFIMGFLVGFSPWIIINLKTTFSGLSIRETSLLNFFDIRNTLNIFSLSPYSLPSKLLASFSPHHLPAFRLKLVLYGYILCFSVIFFAYFFNAIQQKKLHSLSIFILIYLACYLLIASTSVYIFERYFIPLHPLIYALIAISTNAIIHQKKFSYFIFPFYFFVLLLGCYSTVYAFSEFHRGTAFKSTGYSYLRLPYLDPCDDYKTCIQYYKKLKPHLSEEEQDKLKETFAVELTKNRLEGKDFEKKALLIRENLPSEFRNFYDYFLGVKALHETQNLNNAIQKISFLESYPGTYEFALRGVINEWGTQPHFIGAPKEVNKLEALIPNSLESVFWRSVGSQIARRKAIPFHEYSAEKHNDIFEGAGMSFFYTWYNNRSLRPPYNHHRFFIGFGRAYYLNSLGSHNQPWLRKDIEKYFDPNQLESIELGTFLEKKTFQ